MCSLRRWTSSLKGRRIGRRRSGWGTADRRSFPRDNRQFYKDFRGDGPDAESSTLGLSKSGDHARFCARSAIHVAGAKKGTTLKNVLLAVFAAAAVLDTSTAWAQVPLFAAKCPSGITADSNAKGQVYVNGKVAKLIKRPDGQITARSAGVYVDITPQGSQPPRVTSTAKDKSVGVCEIISFKAPGNGSTAGAARDAQRASSSERAGQGQFDARGRFPVRCVLGSPCRSVRPLSPEMAAAARRLR